MSTNNLIAADPPTTIAIAAAAKLHPNVPVVDPLRDSNASQLNHKRRKVTHPRIKYSGFKNKPLNGAAADDHTHDSVPAADAAQPPAMLAADGVAIASALSDMCGVLFANAAAASLKAESAPTATVQQPQPDVVQYADIDDIELPDGSQIGGYPADFAPPSAFQMATAASAAYNDAANMKAADVNHTAERTVFAMMYAGANSNSGGSAVIMPPDVSDGASYRGAFSASFDAPPAVAGNRTYGGAMGVGVGGGGGGGGSGDESLEIYSCRHCGKTYRWKSTLRRHENDECGDKKPAHECPYCPYKAKQRGNLGVHVRKHHGDMPQLESRRKKRSSV